MSLTKYLTTTTNLTLKYAPRHEVVWGVEV